MLRDIDIIMFEGLSTSGAQRRWKIEEIEHTRQWQWDEPVPAEMFREISGRSQSKAGSRSTSGGKKMGKFGVGLATGNPLTMQKSRHMELTPEEGGIGQCALDVLRLDEPSSFTMIPEPIPRDSLEVEGFIQNLG